MAGFGKLSINRKEENRNEILSREMMKQVKGGGGGCYSICNGTLTIRQDCDFDGCPTHYSLYCYGQCSK